MASTESQNLWKAARLSVALTTIGAIVTIVTRQFINSPLENSPQYLTVNLVRNSMPVLSIIVAVFVVSVIRDTHTPGRFTIGIGDCRAWILTTIFLSSSVLFIEGPGLRNALLLGSTVVLFILMTTLYYSLVVVFIASNATRIAVMGILLPSLIGSIYNTSPTASPTAVVLSLTVIHGVSFLVLGCFALKRHLGICIQRGGVFCSYLLFIAISSMSLLLGAVNIPLRMNSLEKFKYFAAVESARLPLFTVVTFLILTSALQVQSTYDPLQSVITRRRLGLLASLIGLLSFFLFLCGLPITQGNSENLLLSICVCLVSTLSAMLLPWFSIRIRDLRFHQIEIYLFILAGVLSVLFRLDVVIWQSVSLVSLVFMLAVLILRHFRLAQPILRSVQVDTSTKLNLDHRSLTSVVIPSYNSGREVTRTVQRVRDAFRLTNQHCEIIVVSDGSTDESLALLENDTNLDLHIWLRSNHGKGAALREGFSRANGEVICFIDADGDLDPVSLPKMSNLILTNHFDIVYGSKGHIDSNVSMSMLRKIVSFAFRWLVRFLFRFEVSDTQTGIKAFNGDFIRSSLKLASEDGFNIDLELFVIAQTLGYGRFGESAIVLNRTGGSSVNIGTLFQMFLSTFRLYQRYRLTLDYVDVANGGTSRG
jgi:hypothetical protein